MRQALSAIAVAAAAIVVTPQLAIAADEDQIVGSGAVKHSFSARVNAQSGPQGEDPQGTLGVIQHGAGRDVSATVTCMVVAGDTAIAGGLDKTDNFQVFVIVRDNGTAEDRATYAFGQFGVEPDQATCAATLASIGSFPMQEVKGNFRVEDAMVNQ